MPSASEEVKKIVASTRKMLLGQLLLPHIDKLKMIHISPQPTVTRELLFYLMETDESELGLVDITAKNEAENELDRGNRNTGQARQGSTAMPLFDRAEFQKSFRVLAAEEDEIWADLSTLVRLERKKSLAKNHEHSDDEQSDEEKGIGPRGESGAFESTSVSVGDPTFDFESNRVAGVDNIKAIDLIITAVTSSVSPIISRTQATALLEHLEQFDEEDELNRNDFVLLVRKWTTTTPLLASLDIERLSLFIFPEAEIEIYLLSRLIRACTRASEHLSYSSELSRKKIEQFEDFREMVVFVPFLALFLAIVLSGKFVTPRTYYGANAVTLYTNEIHTYQFNRLSADLTTNLGETIDVGGVSSHADIYAFLLNGLGNSLWPDAGIAASRPMGSLDLVGAFKVRQLRVLPSQQSPRAARYMNYTKGDVQFAGYNGGNADTSKLTRMNTTSYLQYVLPPWDGSTYGTCEQLNGSDVTLGNAHYYGCIGHAVVVPFNTTRSEYATVIRGLMEQQWLDRGTRAVLMSFISFHPASTMMASTEVIVELRAGGSYTVNFKAHPFAFYTFTSNSPAVSALYYLFFVYLFALIIRTIYLHFYIPYKRIEVQFNVWHIADIINYIVFLISVFSRIVWIARGKPTDPVWQIDHYPSGYESTRVLFNLIVIYDSFNIIVSVIGMVRYAKYVPGVSLVVRSLIRAAPDAAALIFIIIGSFMSMVLCANAAFGDSVFGYHTIPWAAETLGEVFISNYDYKSLHVAHPTFAFIYFFVFQIMFTMILINMFVAVFTDAFGDTVECAVDHDQVREILSNNSRHTFERASIFTALKSCFPVQSLKATVQSLKASWKGTSPDPYNFNEYYPLMVKCFHDILTPEDIIKEQMGLKTDKELNSVRLLAIFHMLQLLRRVPIPPNLQQNDDLEGVEYTTTIYDFLGDSLGEFDYPLLMTYYVLVPQTLFGAIGETSIIDVLDGRKAWFDEVSLSSLKAEETDQLELRVRAVVAERNGARGNKKRRSTINRSMTMTAATPKVVIEFLSTLDHLSKRLFFAIICLARKDEYKQQLSLELFANLLSRCPDYPKELPAEDLWEHMRLNNVPSMKMKDLRGPAVNQMALQVLSAELSAASLQAFAKILSERKKTMLTRQEFADLWFEVHESKISEHSMDRFFSLFPDGTMDMHIFVANARSNLSSHSFTSFESSFVKKGRANTSSFMWFLFYIPFFSLVLYFLNIEHGDHLWMVEGFRKSFPTEGTRPSDAEAFLVSAVDTVWSQPNKPAQNMGSNFLVGGIRFRQQRIKPEQCERVFSDYFGSKVSRQIAWPAYLAGTNERAFYQSRIQTQYKLLNQNLSCLGAYDFGQYHSTEWNIIDGPPTITSSIPEVVTAFQHDAFNLFADNDPITAKSSTFGAGGFGIFLNTSVTREYAVQAIQDLIDNMWIDTHTRVVVMEFIAFSVNLEKFCRVRRGYEITGIGIVNPIDSMYVVGLEGVSPLMGFLSFVMFSLIVIYIVSVVMRFADVFRMRMKQYGDPFWLAPFMVFHTEPVIPVDMTIILTFIITYILRYSTTQNYDVVGGLANQGKYPLDVQWAAAITQHMTKLMGTNVFLVFLRFLAILSTIEPHISSFLATLRAAAADLLSIISLWVFSLFTFTLSAVILFGYVTSHSFNLQSQFFDLFNTASGGNPAFVDYKYARREAASVFFLIYIVVSFFILYNMVVAVLTDQFSKVKDSLYDASVATMVIGDLGAFSLKGFFKNHVLYREIISIFYNIQYCFNVPFGLRNRNPRLLWELLATLWERLDTGTPVEVVSAGSTLVALSYEAGRLHWSEMHRRKQEVLEEEAEAAAEAAADAESAVEDAAGKKRISKRKKDEARKKLDDAKKLAAKKANALKVSSAETFIKPPTVKDHRLMHRHKPATKTEEESFPIRLQTVADRRIPLWEEFIFYRFGNERDCIHRYLVWLPSILLGIPERSLWLDVLEQHYYFMLLRERYTVDLSESQLVQIYKLLPETNEITITHLELAAEEKEVLDAAFPEFLSND